MTTNLTVQHHQSLSVDPLTVRRVLAFLLEHLSSLRVPSFLRLNWRVVSWFVALFRETVPTSFSF